MLQRSKGQNCIGIDVAYFAIYLRILSFEFHAIERHLAVSDTEPVSSLSKLAGRYRWIIAFPPTRSITTARRRLAATRVRFATGQVTSSIPPR